MAKITVGRVGSSVSSITQFLVAAPNDKRKKLNLLVDLLNNAPSEDIRTLVFVQKKHVATWVKKQLAMLNVQADDIHGDRSQSQREAALSRFKSGACNVLVATDVRLRSFYTTV